jgi:capsular polysaccharide biosynthesis protein
VKHIPLYPRQVVHRPLPVNYDEMNACKASFIHTEEKIQSSEIIELENAYVSPFGVVFKNGSIVKESMYSMFSPKKQALSFYKKILLNKIRHVSGACIVAHHAYYENYFHFLLEIMPRLFALKDRAHELKLIMNSRMPSFVKQYIELFGFREIVLLNDDELAKTDKIVFATFLSRGLAYNETIMKDMALWLREKLVRPDAKAPGRIFISRNEARYRRTVNEAEVFAMLKDRGFEKFDLSDPDIHAQATFFSRAEYITGSHGAGFSNLIFSNRCRLVIDLIHKNHPQDCFYNLASVFNTGYYYFQCEGTGRDSFPNNDDIKVDLAKFTKVIDQYISRP